MQGRGSKLGRGAGIDSDQCRPSCRGADRNLYGAPAILHLATSPLMQGRGSKHKLMRIGRRAMVSPLMQGRGSKRR